MRLFPLTAPLFLVLLSGRDNFADNARDASKICSYTPSGTVNINVGQQQTFGAQIGCSGLGVEISPANGTAGFTSGSECSLTTFTTGPTSLFKVRGCQDGTVTVNVRDGSTVIQTITVVVSYL